MGNLQVSRVGAGYSTSALGSSATPVSEKPVFKRNLRTKVDSFSTGNRKDAELFNTMSLHLDIPNENVSIHRDKNGTKYLKISRPKNSSDSEKRLYRFGKIKENLKLKDYVLYNNNGKRQGLSKTAEVFDATEYDMDTLSIAPGHYLFVPLLDIGKKQEEKGIIFKSRYYSAKALELQEAVNKYLKN